MALFCSVSASALPLEWRADWPDCKPVEKYVHRGTDVELKPTWYINGELAASSNWIFSVYVQTNRQAAGEWFGPIAGSTFSHTNDIGAAMYTVMLRADIPGGEVNYTAFARLRMLDSPGFAPGALPLPAKTIDFSQVVALNAPWLLPPATNGFIKVEADPTVPGATNALNASLSSRLSLVSRDATNYTDSAISAAIAPANPTFSNAVLAVGLNIDTNAVAVLNEIAADFGGFPLSPGSTATTVGGLLAALAAAVAWLKKNKVNNAAVAPVFSTSATYAVGDVVMHEGARYKCTTAVTVAGDWTGSTNWTAESIQSVIGDVESALNIINNGAQS